VVEYALALTLLIPIAVSGEKVAGQNYLDCVRWLPFRVREVAANEHVGTLLGPEYVVRQQPATILAPWVPGAGGPTSVRTIS
jgi:hypothetical protein